MYVTMQLLLLGHNVANTNFTVKNTAYYDLLCQKNGSRKAYPIQVKTTFNDSFRTGLTHDDFMDNDGYFDEIKGRKRTEEKVQCSWAFVLVDGAEITPLYKIFVLTRQQVIDLIFESEYWYLTDCGRVKPDVSRKGTVDIIPLWLEGGTKKATSLHTNIFQNPLKGLSLVNRWENIWVD